MGFYGKTWKPMDNLWEIDIKSTIIYKFFMLFVFDAKFLNFIDFEREKTC